MTITQRIAFGAAASWFSRGVTILLGLVLLPVLFRHLPKEELGVWLLLGQSWAALGIFDLGFGVTLTRRIAFAKGKSGSDSNLPFTGEFLNEIADLVATGRRIYCALAMFALICSFGTGLYFIQSLNLSVVSQTNVWLAWGVLCVSQGLGVWATVWICLLQGVGYVGWDAIIASVVNALTLAVQIVFVLLGGGLIMLAAAAATGALIQRFLILGFARRKWPELFGVRGRWNGEVFRKMISPGLKAWLTALGAVLVFQTDQFFIAGFQGVQGIPAYRGAFLLALNFHMLAAVLASASGVFVSHLWAAGRIAEIRDVVWGNLRLGLTLMLVGSAGVLVLGERLFDFWLGPGNFVGYPTLVVLLVIFVMDQHSFTISTMARSTDYETFAWWALAAGILKMFGSWFLMPLYGFLGLALATLIALMMTNHWYVVYRGLARLQIDWRAHARNLLLPCIGVFAVALVACLGVLQLLKSYTLAIQVVGVGIGCAIALLGSVWVLVIEPQARARIQNHWLGALIRYGR